VKRTLETVGAITLTAQEHDHAGFEKMQPGSLAASYDARAQQPMDKHLLASRVSTVPVRTTDKSVRERIDVMSAFMPHNKIGNSKTDPLRRHKPPDRFVHQTGSSANLPPR
jgi:hypothetical protein